MWEGGGEPSIYTVDREGKNFDKIVENAYKAPTWSPDGKELLYRKTVAGHKLLFKIDFASRTETPLARLGPTTRHGQNTGWDWFDPKVLPVSPEPHLLTTAWAKVKTTN